MTDSPPASPPQMHRKTTPPPSPPSPDPNDYDYKASRKREREVSTEPVPIPRQNDNKAARLDSTSRTPAKKNRTQLGYTEEEEDITRSRSNSPPNATPSPPHSMKIKVRQISRGVEDLHCQKDGASSSDKDEPLVVDEPKPDTEIDNIVVTTGDDGAPTTPPSDPSPVAVTAVVDDASSQQDAPSPPNDSAMSDPLLPVSDSEKDKTLKRKHSERGTSQAPPDDPAPSGVTESSKRIRDDAEIDDNPRETKRPSPPPDKRPEPTNPNATADIPAPKLGGFMAYASTSSPFASVKGQNVFAPTPNSTPRVAVPKRASLTSTGSPVLGESSSSSTATKPTAQKRSGFEAFASSASPFASVARAKSPVLGFQSSGHSSASSSSSALSSSPTGKLNRNKSPSRRANTANLNPFGSYLGSGTSAFAVVAAPAPKKARTLDADEDERDTFGSRSPFAGSSGSFPSSHQKPAVLGSAFGDGFASVPKTNGIKAFVESSSGGASEGSSDEANKDAKKSDTKKKLPVSFGEKLRAERDTPEEGERSEEEQQTFEEQDLVTGEEDEETIHQVRGKLFSLGAQNAWTERGTGLLKLNVRRADGGGARLIMRKEAVYKLLLNVTLFKGMRCSLDKDPRYVRFSAIEDGATMHYNLRVPSAKIAQELLEEININIPDS